MSFNIPEDKGAKKRKQYWNFCISFAVIAIIILMIGVSTVQEPTGKYVTIDGYQYYQCEDGELIFYPEEEIRAMEPTHPNDGECMPDDKINQIFKSQPLPNSGDSMYSSKGVAIQITNP